ncbi:hypothetical protein B0A49_13693 [Cryomyces minteri]|uniref:Uncharacterized protein n=1 Tax=Cryomyces minteri TaxID=331657 RepID=A0A4U0VNT4_9PEZI|nr:hypothetical protein B0A49_13693 [Cryomyces minteri]
MSQQVQTAFGVPVNPNIRLHFWDMGTAAYAEIAKIFHKGEEYANEDVVWAAWLQICIVYFPSWTANPTGPRWAIERESYRGPPPLDPSQIKPDILAIKLTPGPPQLGQPPQFNARDFLWIECKAPKHDKPFGWKDALNEATQRLQHAHPGREVFLLIAIGLKCMFCVWDPINFIQQQPRLFVRSADNKIDWPIDPRIKPFLVADWVDRITGQIRTTLGMSLDCWSEEQVPGGQSYLRNWRNLGRIEETLVAIQNIALQGFNPAEF